MSGYRTDRGDRRRAARGEARSEGSRSGIGFGLAVLLAGALVASPASALIIDNGNSMFDTVSGLEWLDLTETQGMTWNEAETSSYATVDGYVHATLAEVTALFLNAGFLTTNNASNAANDPAAAALLSALGCTQFCGTANALGRGFADWNGAGTTTRPFYRASPLGGASAVTSLLTSNLDLADASAGHYMVRAIPEPTSALLMGLGLVLLGAHRRRGPGTGSA